MILYHVPPVKKVKKKEMVWFCASTPNESPSSKANKQSFLIHFDDLLKKKIWSFVLVLELPSLFEIFFFQEFFIQQIFINSPFFFLYFFLLGSSSRLKS